MGQNQPQPRQGHVEETDPAQSQKNAPRNPGQEGQRSGQANPDRAGKPGQAGTPAGSKH